jgi:serine/threonine protein kinase, bacterial
VDEVAFGRYRLLSLIGEGGMGKVYKAHDTVIGRDVAIKVLPAELAAEPGYRERFRREAHTAARLNEPHIVPIHDTGEIDGQLYLVMPVIEGIDVQGLLQRDGPMSPQRSVQVIEQLAAALDAAHAVGLVHRDIKPSNALMTGHDFVYLIDFGIAHAAAATKLTSTGMIVGTLAYMAPERFTAGVADARSDVYALACVLHECLTGDHPYPGESMEQQIAGHLTLDPPRPSAHRPDLPVGFDDVIARGMAKDPDQRYQSAHDLAAAARHALATAPRNAHTAAAVLAPPPQPAPDTALPQVGNPRITATPQRKPAQPPAPPAQPADRRPPQSGTSPPPRRRRQRRGFKWALIAAVVVVVTAVGVTGYLMRSPSPASQAPTSQSGLPAGQPAQPAPASAQTVLPITGLNGPAGVAVDNAGTVYIADTGNGRVLTLATDASSATELPFSGLSNPSGVAVDSERSVYVTNVGNNEVLKLSAGASSTTELHATGLNAPHSVAVDTAKDLFIVDGANRVLKLSAGSISTTELPFTGLSNPAGVAVDSAGTVYVTDTGNNRVLKLTANSATPTALPFTGLSNPAGVAVDSAGTVYVTDTGNNRVLKLTANSATPTVLAFNGLRRPGAVAVDSGGNLYVADTGNNRVVRQAAG